MSFVTRSYAARPASRARAPPPRPGGSGAEERPEASRRATRPPAARDVERPVGAHALVEHVPQVVGVGQAVVARLRARRVSQRAQWRSQSSRRHLHQEGEGRARKRARAPRRQLHPRAAKESRAVCLGSRTWSAANGSPPASSSSSAAPAARRARGRRARRAPARSRRPRRARAARRRRGVDRSRARAARARAAGRPRGARSSASSSTFCRLGRAPRFACQSGRRILSSRRRRALRGRHGRSTPRPTGAPSRAARAAGRQRDVVEGRERREPRRSSWCRRRSARRSGWSQHDRLARDCGDEPLDQRVRWFVSPPQIWSRQPFSGPAGMPAPRT